MKNIFSSISLNAESLVTLVVTTSLFCTLSLQADEGLFEETRGHSSHRYKEKECRDCDFVITAKEIGCEGVELCKSGYYCLCEDVVFNPKSDATAAIRISASNVTLDLRGRTLSQKSKDVLPVDGIVVDPGLTNIIIKNGTVRDFSDAGLRVGAVSTAAVPLVTELSISDIRSFNNGLSTTFVGPTGDNIGGAVLLNTQDVKITNCDFNENFLSGLWTFNTTKFTMENCHCDDNLSANLVTPNYQTAFGASVTGIVVDALIKKCTFNRNTSTGFGAAFNSGFSAVPHLTTNIIFDSCQFNDTTVIVSNPEIAAALVANGGTQSLGIEMRLATNVTFNNCESNGCSLTLNTQLDIRVPSYYGTVTTSVQGFNIRFCNNATFANCSSSGLTFSK